jgi:formyltetrahydrofolate deformylase
MKKKSSRSTLIIRCSDKKGLVHGITGILFKNDLNIVSTSEFVDRNKNIFFMRVEFEGDAQNSKIEKSVLEILPKNSHAQVQAVAPKKIIIFATKEPHCIGDLLLKHEYNELNAEIQAVISQYDNLESLAKRFKVPFHHVPVDPDQPREKHEAKIEIIMKKYDWDYLVLAKYMRILTESFTKNHGNKIINIHHSFLPAFIGASPYDQAHQRGVKIIGATSHFVNEKLDEGPIITQSVIPVNHAHSPIDMARAGRDVERTVLARALKLVFEDRVIVDGNRTIVFE